MNTTLNTLHELSYLMLKIYLFVVNYYLNFIKERTKAQELFLESSSNWFQNSYSYVLNYSVSQLTTFATIINYPCVQGKLGPKYLKY